MRKKAPVLSLTLFTIATILLLPLFSSAQAFYQCDEHEPSDLKVWAAESLEEADFCICFVYERSELGAEGVVYQVPTPEEAELSLIFVDDKSQSELSVWIVDTPEEAGFRNKEKAEVLKKAIAKHKR